MAIKYNGTTIPTSGTIKYNGVSLTKVIYNGVVVWTKGTQTSWVGTAYNRSTSSTATFNTTHDFGSAKSLVSVHFKVVINNGATPRYRFFGSNNNSTWTQLAEWSPTSSGNKTITVSGSYRYVKLEQYKYNYYNSSYSDPYVYSVEPVSQDGWKVTYLQ